MSGHDRSEETQDQRFQRDLQSYAQEQDFCKHLATLDTGSIVLLATFLEKLSARPDGKFLVALSLVAFACSIVGTIFVQFASFVDVSHEGWFDSPRFIWSYYFALGGFLIGIVSLMVFALVNLW